MPRRAPLLTAESSAIDFPSSYLYCATTNSGIWVRVQMECRGCLTDLASGETNEYVMGVMAKTGLVPVAGTGYDCPRLRLHDHLLEDARFHEAFAQLGLPQ